MNKVILAGRLCRDPETRYAGTDNSTYISRYTLAVDRPSKNDSNEADFIPCVALGRNGEFAEKYLNKGSKIIVEGRIQTGSYENNNHERVYYTEVLVQSHEFCESKSKENRNARDEASMNNASVDPEGFMNIPDGIDEELPFN